MTTNRAGPQAESGGGAEGFVGSAFRTPIEPNGSIAENGGSSPFSCENGDRVFGVGGVIPALTKL